MVDHGVLGQTTEENIITLQSPHKVRLTVTHCSRLREGERERERERVRGEKERERVREFVLGGFFVRHVIANHVGTLLV